MEGEPPALFIGVELDRWQEEDRAAAMDALGRALAAAPLPWPVHLLLLDVAQDPVGDWMHGVGRSRSSPATEPPRARPPAAVYRP